MIEEADIATGRANRNDVADRLEREMQRVVVCRPESRPAPIELGIVCEPSSDEVAAERHRRFHEPTEVEESERWSGPERRDLDSGRRRRARDANPR